MQKSQPHFTSEQRRELVEEHPWMRRGGLPAAINVKVRIVRFICKLLNLVVLTETLLRTVCVSSGVCVL